ncbi:caspase family protein [Streptomyces sp. SS7]|uniref:caspase family protein n=1 Tax=Streptomyces sp. SS7 TaxID=3108485 RepID=UPI0030ED6E19
MPDLWWPDGELSRILLLGTVEYQSTDLTPMLSVRDNLTGLRALLTDPDRGLFLPSRCRVLGDDEPLSMSALGAALAFAAQDATDLLLVYYAGHGLLDEDGRLYLSLPETDPDNVGFSAIPVDLILRSLGRARAKARVLILDCCFSGRAVAAMTSPGSVVVGQLEHSGTYTLTSTTHTAPSYAPPGEEHTAFTGALLRALKSPAPLTLNEIHKFIDAELVSRGLPRPQSRAVNTAGSLALARPPILAAQESAAVPKIPAELVFGKPPLKAWIRWCGMLSATALLLADPPLTYYLWGPLKGGPSVLLLTIFMVLVAMIIFPRRSSPTLTINTNGLSLSPDRGSPHHTDVSWEDVMYIGLLASARLRSGQEHRTHRNILLVRPRPGVYLPLYPLGEGEFEKLGYHTLGTLKEFNADPILLREAVMTFAPNRFRTNSQLFDLDPRLISLAERQSHA